MSHPFGRRVSRRAVIAGGGLGVAAAAALGFGLDGNGADHPVEKHPIAAGDPRIREAQRRLDSLGYWCGPATGVVNDLTACAVMAFQKVHGLEVDGVLDDELVHRLSDASPAKAFAKTGSVLEVDLDRQVVRAVEKGKVTLILHASTGDGDSSRRGSRVVLDSTPQGRFRILRAHRGRVTNALGTQYSPHYFLGTYAIYGQHGMAKRRGPSTSGGIAIDPQALDHLAELGVLHRDRLVHIA